MILSPEQRHALAQLWRDTWIELQGIHAQRQAEVAESFAALHPPAALPGASILRLAEKYLALANSEARLEGERGRCVLQQGCSPRDGGGGRVPPLGWGGAGPSLHKMHGRRGG